MSPPRDTELAYLAIQRLQWLVELFQQRRAQLASGVGLTEHQWGVLEEISTEHFMPSMFARQRESSAAAVSKILRQLQEKGLVESAPSGLDKRQRKYQLTAKGKRTMNKLRRAREEAVARVWLKLDPALLQTFVGFSNELGPRLEELLDAPQKV